MNSDDIVQLQREIHDGIPLSNAMGFEITALGETRMTVRAPLPPNINVHSTGFAGSLYALGILTGWGMIRHLIVRRDLNAELVVAEATIRYRSPVRSGIECRCEVSEEDAAAFIGTLERGKPARLLIEVRIGQDDAARLTATMVAKPVAD